MTRRGFLALAGTAGTLSFLRGSPPVSAAEEPHLHTRPAPPTTSIEPGRHKLGLGGDRDGLLYIPRGHVPRAATPLAVMLHGASRNGQAMEYLFSLADEFGVVIIAPDSRARTWDVIVDDFGPDVRFIDAALKHAFERCAVDPKRLALGGFSDGASYALSVGLANGDVFSHVIAFSPGFIAPAPPHMKPRIFISHGTEDAVLRIANASRRIAPALTAVGYEVTYREFEGPHTVPLPIAREAFEWFTR